MKLRDRTSCVHCSCSRSCRVKYLIGDCLAFRHAIADYLVSAVYTCRYSRYLHTYQVQAVLRLHGFLNDRLYFGTLICRFSTKSLLRLHGFLLTRLFFRSLKKQRKDQLYHLYLLTRKVPNYLDSDFVHFL